MVDESRCTLQMCCSSQYSVKCLNEIITPGHILLWTCGAPLGLCNAIRVDINTIACVHIISIRCVGDEVSTMPIKHALFTKEELVFQFRNFFNNIEIEDFHVCATHGRGKLRKRKRSRKK